MIVVLLDLDLPDGDRVSLTVSQDDAGEARAFLTLAAPSDRPPLRAELRANELYSLGVALSRPPRAWGREPWRLVLVDGPTLTVQEWRGVAVLGLHTVTEPDRDRWIVVQLRPGAVERLRAGLARALATLENSRERA